MSAIKINDVSNSKDDSGEDKDWAAAKAAYDSLRSTKKPRPVSAVAYGSMLV